MPKIKNILFCLLFSALCLLPSCNNKLTPANVQKFAVDVNTLNSTIDKYQQSADIIITTLQQSKIVDSNFVAKFQKIEAEIDRVQSQVKSSSSAVASQPLSTDDLQNWITLASAANTSTASINPYSGLIDAFIKIASIIAGIIGSIIAIKKSQDAKVATTALEEVVKGAEVFKDKADLVAVNLFKSSQGEAQSADTKKMVAVIKAVV